MIKRTGRGFKILQDTDIYGSSYSCQKSSVAIHDAIWLGVDDPQPQIMASEAKEHGIETTETAGWIPYPIPKEVLITTRMHLDREKVAKLIPYLQYFVEHGDLPENELPPMEYEAEDGEK